MKNVPWKNTLVRLPVMLALILAAGGCMQLELAIEMHEEDGGATLTERIRFSEALLDLDAGVGGKIGLSRRLGRTGAQSRMKTMGRGIALKSHAENNLPDGSRESVAVYHIPNIEDLRLPNPFVQSDPPAPAPARRLDFSPIHKSNRRHEIGSVRVRVVVAESSEGSGAEPVEAIAAATPLEMQLYRDLQPVFSDLLKDFEVKIVLTVPDQPASRGRPSGDRTITLLHFNDKHMDRYAEPFLRNEEAMLSLLQFKWNDAAITDHTKDFPRNPQVPIHRGRSNWASTHFRIRPTRHLFRKHFAGRPKSEGGDQ